MVEFYSVKESGANLSRLLQHIDENDICFITTYRSNLKKVENIKRNKQLALDIHNIGLSFIKVVGGYFEQGDTEPTKEATFAVIHKPTSKEEQDEFFTEMLGLCKLYDQDAVLISLRNRPDIPKASYSGDGKIVYGPFTTLTTQGIEEFFTQVHGHRFKMESFTESEKGVSPRSMIKAMAYYGTKERLKMLGTKRGL